MPRTLTAFPTDRLMAVVTGILGTEWTPPAVPEWPVTFINESADRELSFHPQPKNHRIVLEVAPAGFADTFGRRRYAKYTPDTTGHDSLGAWLADGDLDAVADALGVVVRRLVDQPLPEPVAPHPDPIGREMELLAKHAQELARLTARFNAGLISGEPVADEASRMLYLAQLTEQAAIRVDELRGPAAAART
ncbi:hypothetical protein OG709_35830 (plasmid) [Streptomyces sp. NBC_01267]|uniref:hypothetical protein n=1 Tax=Streptomyces sp. NBC_01267 TaxID=2903805 RepID=UPI002E3276B4|nr:hypothetical protein [Streptomyces sp. NBC_01267]